MSVSLMTAALPGLASAQDETVVYPVEGVQWQLSSYLDGGAIVDVPEGVEVSLLMNGGEAVGNAVCNSYFGSYEIGAESLTFPNSFGSTQAFCAGPGEAVAAVYLSLLQPVEGWTVDEAGMLELTGPDGEVSLIYGEAPVTITATDLEALADELANLQAQIDQAEADLESLNVQKMNNRISANEESIDKLDKKTKGLNVDGLKKRISANEKAIADESAKVADLNKTVNKLRDRIKALEESDADQEARITALEAAPEQPQP
jgi:heat shock protein HslJ/uncharacterized coiled-coil protein SlyX